MAEIYLTAIGQRKSGKSTVLSICMKALKENGFNCTVIQKAPGFEEIKVSTDAIAYFASVDQEIMAGQVWQHRQKSSMRVVIVGKGKILQNTWINAISYYLQDGKSTDIYSVSKESFLDYFIKIYHV
jgi:Thymidine kinase.